MYTLGQFNTTDTSKLTTEVEQKTTFSLDRCELSIFETHTKADNVKLHFDGFTVTSMLRGKKILHGAGDKVLDYVPGETFMLPAAAEMIIDFPEADYQNPTQCTALVIEDDYLQKQLAYINEMFPREKEQGDEWTLNMDQLFLRNDEKIAFLSTRLMRLFSGDDPMKDLLVDIKIKELVLSIMRLQNHKAISTGRSKINERFRAVVDYIRKNITADITPSQLSQIACMSKSVFYRAFNNEFGTTPNNMILQEKIRHAKMLLEAEDLHIREVCFSSGFSDPNYFSRVFKKIEGMTPGEYKTQAKMVG